MGSADPADLEASRPHQRGVPSSSAGDPGPRSAAGQTPPGPWGPGAWGARDSLCSRVRDAMASSWRASCQVCRTAPYGHDPWSLRSEGCSQPLIRGRGTNGRCPRQAVVVESAAHGQGLARCARPQQTALASRTNQRSKSADDAGTAAFPQGASVAALQRCIVAGGRPPLAANLPIKVRHGTGMAQRVEICVRARTRPAVRTTISYPEHGCSERCWVGSWARGLVDSWVA